MYSNAFVSMMLGTACHILTARFYSQCHSRFCEILCKSFCLNTWKVKQSISLNSKLMFL